MNGKRLGSLIVVLMGFAATGASAKLISVSGPTSSADTLAEIIVAPAHILDDMVDNTGMQGFDEAQDVVTTVNHGLDAGAILLAGSRVSSHMIFLNSEGDTRLNQYNVDWVFEGEILGVMSDRGGQLEASSSFELGAPGTNYTVTFPGSGPAAPYGARGLENNYGSADPFFRDGYWVSDNVLTVSMHVTEPGDWIRVVTAVDDLEDTQDVPEPASLLLFAAGLLGFGFVRRPRA